MLDGALIKYKLKTGEELQASGSLRSNNSASPSVFDILRNPNALDLSAIES